MHLVKFCVFFVSWVLGVCRYVLGWNTFTVYSLWFKCCTLYAASCCVMTPAMYYLPCKRWDLLEFWSYHDYLKTLCLLSSVLRASSWCACLFVTNKYYFYEIVVSYFFLGSDLYYFFLFLYLGGFYLFFIYFSAWHFSTVSLW